MNLTPYLQVLSIISVTSTYGFQCESSGTCPDVQVKAASLLQHLHAGNASQEHTSNLPGFANVPRSVAFTTADLTLAKFVVECPMLFRHMKEDKFVVFGCEDEESCGGIGDRFFGLFGSFMLSVSLNRTFKINWPGFSDFYDTVNHNWKYDRNAIGMDDYVQEQLHAKALLSEPEALNSINEDVALLTFFNGAGLFEQYEHFGEFDKARILFSHGNRGLTEGWVNSVSSSFAERYEEGWHHIYRCMFAALFKPSALMLETPVNTIDGNGMPLHSLLAEMESPNTYSVLFHSRVHDHEITNTERGKISLSFSVSESCMLKMTTAVKKNTGKSFPIAIVIANNNLVVEEMCKEAQASKMFYVVWCVKNSVLPHVDRVSIADRAESTRQALTSLTLMQHADVVHTNSHYGWISGFVVTAMKTSPKSQLYYNDHNGQCANVKQTYCYVAVCPHPRVS